MLSQYASLSPRENLLLLITFFLSFFNYYYSRMTGIEMIIEKTGIEMI